MSDPRIHELVRNFPENGLKLLLEDPRNLRDVFLLDQYPEVQRLDFDRLELDRTTYIQPDFRHVMTDLVYRIPFRFGKTRTAADFLTVYLLLEHESEPDEWTSLWLLGYLSAIYLDQHRTASVQGLLQPGWQLQPVLPIILYTGNRTWKRVKPLTDLVNGAPWFGAQLPSFTPRFVNLDHLSEHDLDQRSTGFGHVLWLLRHRRKKTGFAPMLARTVQRLEQLQPTQHTRWLNLLSYLHALVYHAHEGKRRAALQQVIGEAVQSDPARQEVLDMGKTIAQELEDQGMAKANVSSRQEVLLRLLRKKFRSVPKEIIEFVRQTRDVDKLDHWLDRFAVAQRLDDVGIAADS